MEFIYCGIVEVPKKRLEDVLHVAKQLQIKGLYNASTCEKNKTSLSSLIRIEEEEESISHQSNEISGCRRDGPKREPKATNYKNIKSGNSLLSGSICAMGVKNKRHGASYQGSIDTDQSNYSGTINVNTEQCSTGNSTLVSHWKLMSKTKFVLIITMIFVYHVIF